MSTSQPIRSLLLYETPEGELRQRGVQETLELYLTTGRFPQSTPLDTTRMDYRQRYKETHKRWNPSLDYSQVKKHIKPSATSAHPRAFTPSPYHEAFMSYLHTPPQLGQEPLPSFLHHTSCEVSDYTYILGGCVALPVKDDLDMSKYVVVESVELPLPLDNELLMSPLLIPNSQLYQVSSLTNRVTAPSVHGDVPPPLLCMTATPINKRYIFYYGGFELINDVAYKQGTFEIKKSVRINNYGYVLDTVTLGFRRLNLTAQPNSKVRDPATIPRFGHSSCAVKIPGDSIANIFIGGGYRYSTTSRSFEPIQDLWRVELTVVREGTNGYIELGDVVLATPTATDRAPTARAFYGAAISKGGILIHGGTDGRSVLGDVWRFDFQTQKWTELSTTYEGRPVQHKKVGHHSVVLDKYFVPLVGCIPTDLRGKVELVAEEGMSDISEVYRTMEPSKTECHDSYFYRMFCLNTETNRWFLTRLYHDYYLPVSGRENYLSKTGALGAAVSMGNSRVFLTGGYLIDDPSSSPFTGYYLLNSPLLSYELPLGCSVEEDINFD